MGMDTEKKYSAKKILDKIKVDDIKPRSSIYFLIQRLVTWASLFLFILVAGHSLGLLIYFLSDFDFALVPLFFQTPKKLLLLSLMTFWLVISFVGGVFAFLKYRKTIRGYRLESHRLAVGILICILFIGWVSYKTEASAILEQSFNEFLPIYQPWESIKISIWSQPNKGFISGTIEKKLSEGKIEIRDFTGNIWSVDISRALLRGQVQLRIKNIIKIIGSVDRDHQFQAREVRPWHPLHTHANRCRKAEDKEACISGH